MPHCSVKCDCLACRLPKTIVPYQTLYLSPIWPLEADPSVYFTTLQDALVQAETFSPSASLPALIIVYPGTYADPALISNISLVAFSPGTAYFNSLSWIPTETGSLALVLQDLVINQLTVNTLAKTDIANAALRVVNSTVSNVTIIGRPNDPLTISQSNITNGTLSTINATIQESNSNELNLSNVSLNLRGSEIINLIANQSTLLNIFNSQINNLNLNQQSVIQKAIQSNIGILTLNSTTSSNILSSSITTIVSINGTLNRDRYSTSSTALTGLTPVPITPNFNDSQYIALFSQVSGQSAYPVVVSTTPGLLVYSAPAGNSYQVVFLH